MIRVLTFAAVLILSSFAAADAQWPQFRGPNGRGVASDAKPLPVEFGPTRRVAWKLRLPRGCSSPCIWNDRIFLTGFDADEEELQTICIDRPSGHIVWRRTAPAQ